MVHVFMALVQNTCKNTALIFAISVCVCARARAASVTTRQTLKYLEGISNCRGLLKLLSHYILLKWDKNNELSYMSARTHRPNVLQTNKTHPFMCNTSSVIQIFETSECKEPILHCDYTFCNNFLPLIFIRNYFTSCVMFLVCQKHILKFGVQKIGFFLCKFLRAFEMYGHITQL